MGVVVRQFTNQSARGGKVWFETVIGVPGYVGLDVNEVKTERLVRQKKLETTVCTDCMRTGDRKHYREGKRNLDDGDL